MPPIIPDTLDPRPWLDLAQTATEADVQRALTTQSPGTRDLAALLSTTASGHLEAMAARARALTRRHFGHTIQLYIPLYLSSYCPGGCAYCGFASDRDVPRHKLDLATAASELERIRAMGLEEVLLLTGERTPEADFDFVQAHVQQAAQVAHKVTVETFPMEEDEYRTLVNDGCTGVTLYQETYHAATYEKLHRWGPKSDYEGRIDAAERLLRAGIRALGLGALLGLGDPVYDMLALYRHAIYLRKRYWKTGLSLSFPRLRPEAGGFQTDHPVSEAMLTQIITAFRIVLPDVPLVLSTRERAFYRDHMAGIGISKMSVASRTTVGGYSDSVDFEEGQFSVSDDRGVEPFTAALRANGLDPVFKNWDHVYSASSL